MDSTAPAAGRFGSFFFNRGIHDLPLALGAIVVVATLPVYAQSPAVVAYRVLATNRTSTMEKEMREAAQAGFRFGDVMGGETSFGGSEVAAILRRKR